MKYLFFYLYLYFITPVFCCYSQIPEVFPIDSLSHWQGDTSFFSFQNGNIISKGPDTLSSIAIYQHLNIPTNTTWEIKVNQGFSPSPSNYSNILLISENKPEKDSLNGYYLRIGGTSGNNDAVDLFYQKGQEHSKIISGQAGLASSEGPISVHIELLQNQYWNLYIDTSNSGKYIFQGAAKHINMIKSGYSGLEFNYTTSRKDKFVIEKFNISNSKPTIQHVEIIHDSLILIILSAPVADSIKSEHVIINQHPLSYINQYSDSVLCYLDQPLTYGSNSIYISNVSIGNYLFNFFPDYSPGSVIINEILFDPEPSKGLPDYEYIELYNKNKFEAQVNGFCLSDYSTTGCIKDTFSMPPESYLILCSEESRLDFAGYGKAISLNPWPSLNNSGDDLTLLSRSGTTLHSVKYKDSWHTNSSKTDGTSLEMINPEFPCLEKENWLTSTSIAGGTPGKKNETYSDHYFPGALKIIGYDYSQNHLTAVFNREIFLKESGSLDIDKTLLSNIRTNEDSLIIVFPFLLGVNQHYQINLSDIEDCLGQQLSNPYLEITIPGMADRGDLIINEILFNPSQDGTDFIELYNKSDNYLNLQEFKLSFQSFEQNQPKEYPLIPYSRLIGRGEYLVLTGDTNKLFSKHPNTVKENTVLVKSFPNLTDLGGNLRLLYNEKTIESCIYSPDFHHPLLVDQEEVSLERVSTIAIATNKENWASASTHSGYATPGFENSQRVQDKTDEELIIEPKIFSPDGDGENDMVFIKYQLPGPGWTARIRIFDQKGRSIKTLNYLSITGSLGFFSWNGQKEDGSIAEMGIYIALIEFFSLEGEMRKFRKTITVGGKI